MNLLHKWFRQWAHHVSFAGSADEASKLPCRGPNLRDHGRSAATLTGCRLPLPVRHDRLARGECWHSRCEIFDRGDLGETVGLGSVQACVVAELGRLSW
jgi:hypothetical protein